MNKLKDDDFTKTMKQIALLIAVVLILGFILIGITLANNQLDNITKSQVSEWQGERNIPDKNYIITGKFLGYGNKTSLNSSVNKGNYSWVTTDKYGLIQVYLPQLKDRFFYKVCQHKIGDNVTYIGAFRDENINTKNKINVFIPFNITPNTTLTSSDFILKRELC